MPVSRWSWHSAATGGSIKITFFTFLGDTLMPDKTPDPEFEREPESLPERDPSSEHAWPPESNDDPRITERPPPEDFGIPHIDLDHSGRFKVPKLKADYCLLEQAHNEFHLGMGLDVPRPIAWLWPERIPIAKLTLIEGESNSGTSFVVTDMAARVTCGSPWPGASGHPGSGQPGDAVPGSDPPDNCPLPTDNCPPQSGHVLFVNGGDNIHDTLTPRMISRGANLYDFTVLAGITTHDPAEMRAGKADTQRRLSLPADLGHIEYQVRKRPDTRLVIVDSLSDFCHTDKQFRETLRGLHEIAERCNVAVVATARPRNGRSARNKLLPSADRRSESVRCVLNVLVDPHDRSQRYLAPARMNFCREPRWLPFRIGDGVVDWGQELEAAPVYQRLNPAAQEKVTLLHEAMDCLNDTLAAGDMPAKTVLKQVMECGYSKGTILRARRELGVRSYRQGWGLSGWWCWSIKPAGEGPAAEEPANGTGENGTGESANGENGNGDEGAVTTKTVMTGPGREKQLSPADEFGGVSFERMFRNLVIESLNQNRAVEAAAMGEALPTSKPSKNGKRNKPR
jgi:hypothetical protein